MVEEEEHRRGVGEDDGRRMGGAVAGRRPT
jgi:hypothetical protein